MQAAYIQVIVLVHAAFAGVFFFLSWQFPNRFARLFAWCWTIEAIRAAILLPLVHSIGGWPAGWYSLADVLCVAANWCLFAGFADVVAVDLPPWLGRAYFWFSVPAVLAVRYLVAPFAQSRLGMEPARVEQVFGFANQLLLFVPVSVARVAIFFWLYSLWRKVRMPGAWIAAAFAIPYALFSVVAPFQYYFSYAPDWILFLWAARVLGFSIGLVILMFDRQHRDLVENESGLAAAQAMAQIGSWRFDSETGAGTWSREMLRLFGYAPADRAPSFTEFLARIHPDDWQSFEPRSGGRAGEAEVRALQPDGEVRWFVIRSYAIPGPDGRRAGLSGTAQDVTERRKLRDQLAQAQKMEGVGQLAAGITHDFNNVLSAIQLQADFLLNDPSLTQHQRGALEELASYAMRGATLTRQLLLFSRQKVMERRGIDLNATVAEFVPMLQRLVGSHIAIQFEPSATLPRFKADPTMVEQIVMNLVVNARDAMPEGGRISISTAEVGHLGAASGEGAKAPPGKYARLSVADTGAGMSDAIRQRIFEPFFTTKEAGTGTGLGLSTVEGIVQQHGGWIEVRSAPGRGSVFHVHLSLAGSAG